MGSFWESFWSYLEIIWGFFLNLVNSLLSLVTTVAGASVIPQVVAGYMWGPIGASVLAVSAFAVIKMLVGRSNV